jgi:hypothetical protein
LYTWVLETIILGDVLPSMTPPLPLATEIVSIGVLGVTRIITAAVV